MNFIKKLMFSLSMLTLGQSMVASTWLQREWDTLRFAYYCALNNEHDAGERWRKLGLLAAGTTFGCTLKDCINHRTSNNKDTAISLLPLMIFGAYSFYKILPRYIKHHRSLVAESRHEAQEPVDVIHYPASTLRWDRHIVQPGYAVPEYKDLSPTELQELCCQCCLNSIDEVKENPDSVGIQMSCCKNIAFCSLAELDAYIKQNDHSACPLCRKPITRFALVDFTSGVVLKNTQGAILEYFVHGQDRPELAYVAPAPDSQVGATIPVESEDSIG